MDPAIVASRRRVMRMVMGALLAPITLTACGTGGTTTVSVVTTTVTKTVSSSATASWGIARRGILEFQPPWPMRRCSSEPLTRM